MRKTEQTNRKKIMAQKIERKVVVTGSARRSNKGGSGNPSFALETTSGRFVTAADTAAAHALENDFPTGETLSVPATLFLDDKGEVIGWDLH